MFKNIILNRPNLRLTPLAYLVISQIILLGGGISQAEAGDYFNPALLETRNAQQGSTDLSVFENNASQAPGVYRVDIYLNNQQVETKDVTFAVVKAANGSESLQPCLSVDYLKDIGVKTELFPQIAEGKGECAKLSAIPQASAEFRFSAQQLLLSIPQAAISLKARDYVPVSQWDNGIPAFLLNYSVSGANTWARDGQSSADSSQYANLRPGLNLGPWRLRNYTTWSRDSRGQDQWDTVYTYMARSIVSLKSQLVLGDSTSPADIFDSVPFRGGQIASDDDMLPGSLKGYAPVVRGIARTNAQVVIRQNGYVIYQTYVAPGAFEITDMFPTGGSGDLAVTIKEADGSQQQFVVPFASLPVLQREGRLKYSVTSGQYRSYDGSVEKTAFTQGTVIYGLPAGMTVYGGGQFSSPYQSLALGLGKNLGDFGAISTDMTQAWSTRQNVQKDNGQSWRIRYSKNVVQTGTNFSIAGYRYSTDGFYSLPEVMDSYRGQSASSPIERRRDRSELTVSQNLWTGGGAVSLSWISESYWNNNRALRSIGAGYNNSWKGISYGLNYSYNENSSTRVNSSTTGHIYEKDQIFAFNISIPLDRWLSNTYISNNMSTSQKNGTTNTLGLNGTALAGNNLSWSAQEGYGSQGTGNSGNLNADYRGTYGEVNGGYSVDKNNERLNYGIQGGMVVHQHGITLGQPLGETIVIVQAPGAEGVGITNQTGVKTDWRGYAIVPYSSPYTRNQVQLDTQTLPDDVDLALTTKNVVPTRGAVVQATFDVSVGQRVLMTILRQGGQPVPFGATVAISLGTQPQAALVGDAGQVYLTGLQESGILDVTWGSGADQQCKVSYKLRDTTDASGIKIVQEHCL